MERDLKTLTERALAWKAKRPKRVRLPKIVLVVDAYHYGERFIGSATPPTAARALTILSVTCADCQCQVLTSVLPAWEAA